MNTASLKYLLLVLMAVGIVVPYVALVAFVAEHGLAFPQLFEEAGANRIAAFAWLDVLISAAVLLVAAFSRQFTTLKQAGLVTLLTLTVGVSAGLPLFLYFAADRPK